METPLRASWGDHLVLWSIHRLVFVSRAGMKVPSRHTEKKRTQKYSPRTPATERSTKVHEIASKEKEKTQLCPLEKPSHFRKPYPSFSPNIHSVEYPNSKAVPKKKPLDSPSIPGISTRYSLLPLFVVYLGLVFATMNKTCIDCPLLLLPMSNNHMFHSCLLPSN